MHLSLSLTPAPAPILVPPVYPRSLPFPLFVFPLEFLLNVKSATGNVIYCKSNLSGSSTAHLLLQGLEGAFHCCCSRILPFLRGSLGPLLCWAGCRQRRRGNLNSSPSTVTNDPGTDVYYVISSFVVYWTVSASKAANHTNLGFIGCFGGLRRDWSLLDPRPLHKENMSLPMLSQGMLIMPCNTNKVNPHPPVQMQTHISHMQM